MVSKYAKYWFPKRDQHLFSGLLKGVDDTEKMDQVLQKIVNHFTLYDYRQLDITKNKDKTLIYLLLSFSFLR